MTEKQEPNKEKTINRDYEFFKIQVYADRIHNFLIIQASLSFVLLGFASIFYALYYEGLFEFKLPMILTGLSGILIILVGFTIIFVSMALNYGKKFSKISDMVETVNEGNALPSLNKLPKMEKE